MPVWSFCRVVRSRPHGRRAGAAARLLRAAATTTVLVTMPAAGAGTGYDIDPASGYRTERYRAPVPDSVPGGVTIDTATARARHADGSLLFVDVFPPKGMGADPLDGSWRVSEPHATIPGAVWLPEVGRGHLGSAHEDYFRRNLERLSASDRAAPLVFFCTADCWQSWNAAKRAAAWGYTGVHWYPLGTDGWREAGGELVAARPINFLDDTTPPAVEGVRPGAPAGGERRADGTLEGTAAALDGVFPDEARIVLIDAEGAELEIGSVRFAPSADGTGAAIDVALDRASFSEHFLSMRPFRCIEGEPEWLCHLPYPYALGDTVDTDDLADLEYRLLFLRKTPAEFGIDAWNGLYYRLAPDGAGGFEGTLLEGDLNVLAAPPEDPDARPIDLDEFVPGEPGRRFPTLAIRP